MNWIKRRAKCQSVRKMSSNSSSNSKTEKSESVGVRPRSAGRLARRARSFKEDLLERFIQMRSPSSTRSASPHKTMHPRFKNESLLSVGCDTQPERISPETDVLNLKKEVENTLRYFQDVIDKKTSILPQSASVVLETVLAIHSALQNHLTDEQSSLLVSSYNQVYQSLASLVKWADVVLIHGEKAVDRDTLSEVVKTVRSAVKTLVDIVIEKLRNKELSNGFGAISNGRAVAPNNESARGNGSDTVDRFARRDPPAEILKTTRSGFPGAATLGHSISSDSILSSCTQNHMVSLDVPPPKPPLLTNNGDLSKHKAWSGGITCSSVPDIGPPALPPKKRFNPNASCRWNHSASLSSGGGGSDRLALSAGSSRDSGEWLTACNGNGRRVTSGSDWSSPINHSPSSLSPRSVSASSLESTLNHSSDELLTTSTLPVSKPQFEFAHSSVAYHCHQSSSCSTTVSWTATRSTENAVDLIQNRLNNLSFEEMSSSGIFSSSSSRSDVNSMSSLTTNATSTSTSLTASPPAIPPKRREGGRPRTNSQYDNVPDSADFNDQLQELTMMADISGLKLSRRVTIADGLCMNPFAAQSLNIIDTEPPPLPPKKKNVMAYMQIFGSYDYSRTVNFSLPACSAAYEMTAHREMSMSRSVTTSTFGFNTDNSFEKPTMMVNGFPEINRITEAGEFHATTPPALPPKKAKVTSSTGQYDFVVGIPTNDTTHVSAINNHSEKMPSDPSMNNYARLSSFSDSLQGADDQNRDVGPKMLDEIDTRPYLILKNEGEEGPEIRGGSVDALIVHSSSAPNAEMLYRDAFMTTYRTFISPIDLVNKLLYRYNKFGHVTDVIRQRVARNTFSLLVCVVGDFGAGDMSEDLLQILCDFGYQLLCNGELALARALRKKVLEKWNAKINGQAAMPPLSSKGVFTKQSFLVDFKSEQLAEQMTLLDADLFQKIEIPEVLVWSRLQKEESSPNLTAFTEHFNKMSYWARSRILEREDAKDRERYVIKFIKIMKHLRKINNFNSYLAILSAIDSAPIRRLEWQKHITEGLKEYCELIDSSSSFRAYRQALSETEPPCIPYIGLILQDLTFVHIGNSDFLQDGSVNFVKRWQQYNILDTMKRFRKCQYTFKPCDRIIAFFNHFDDHLCEEAMWQISEQIKPRPKKVEQPSQQNRH